jgi:hypothetical protein
MPSDDPGGLDSLDLGSRQAPFDLSVWTGIKLGIGFSIGAALVLLALSLIAIAALGIDVPGSRF